MLSESLRSSSIISIFLDNGSLLIQHHNTAGRNEQCADDDAAADRLLEKQERQADGYYHAELVYGGHARHVALLQGLEAEEPRHPRGGTRQHQEQPRMAGDRLDVARMGAHQGYAPCNEQDDGGTDCRGQVRVNVFYPYLGEDCRQGGKES